MPVSKKRGGKKAHNKRVKNRNKRIEDLKRSNQNLIAKKIAELQRKDESNALTPLQEKMRSL